MPLMEAAPASKPNRGAGHPKPQENNLNTANTSHHLRRAAALVAALVVAALAFGVGLPWILSDAPPATETLWAREVQMHAPAMSLSGVTLARRASGRIVTR